MKALVVFRTNNIKLAYRKSCDLKWNHSFFAFILILCLLY